MKKKHTDNWTKEFSKFLETDPVAVPNEIGAPVLHQVEQDLNPSPWRVFRKAGLIQVVMGFITLLFCPQFGLSLTGIHGIMHVFMRYGDTACMFGCGLLFAGSSLLVSSIALSPDEVRAFRKHRTLQFALLGLLTMGTFLCLGAEVWETLTLVWLAGYFLGGIASLELGWMARRWIRSRVIYG